MLGWLGQAGQVAIDEPGVERPVGELRISKEVAQEVQVGGHALNARFAQRPVALAHRGRIVAVRGVNDQLGEQGIEGGIGGVAGVAEAVGAQSGAGGQFKQAQGAACRLDAAILAKGFHVDPRLNGEALGGGDVGLLKAELRECRAFGNLQLGAHQVDAGHFLGDGVLHLQAGVGFDEGKAIMGHQKLHGAGAAVVGRLAEAQGCVGERFAQVAIEIRSRGDFHELLAAALNAAFPLPQVADRAAAVAKNLHLNVAGPGQVLFQVQ